MCIKVRNRNIAIIDGVRTSGATGNTLGSLAKDNCNVNNVYLIVAGRTYFAPSKLL